MYKGLSSAPRKEDILPFAATWVELEGIVPSDRIRERQMLCDLAYMQT